MAMTDPVADMLTRIRNAGLVGHETVAMPRSGLKVQILRIMEQEGFIGGVQDDGRTLRVQLRFDQGRRAVIQGLKRVSTPGRRTYVGKDEIPYVRDGLGVAILTIFCGVLTDRAARQAGVGGEVLCYVW